MIVLPPSWSKSQAILTLRYLPKQTAWICDIQQGIWIALSPSCKCALTQSLTPWWIRPAKSCWTGATSLPHRGTQHLISCTLETAYLHACVFPSKLPPCDLGEGGWHCLARLVPARKPAKRRTDTAAHHKVQRSFLPCSAPAKTAI